MRIGQGTALGAIHAHLFPLVIAAHLFPLECLSEPDQGCAACGFSTEASILVSVSFSGDQAGMRSVWAASGDADCIHVYASEEAAGSLLIPEEVAGKVSVAPQGLHGEGQGGGVGECGMGWRGYHVVMDDTILYPEGYLESLVSVIGSYSHEVIVGHFGFVWIGELIIKKGEAACPAWKTALIDRPTAVHESVLHFPEAGGLSGAAQQDTWVDVLSLGTLGYHAKAAHQAHARTGSREDFWVGRFLPAGLDGMADVRFAAALNYAGIPRIVCFHNERWLAPTDPASPRASPLLLRPQNTSGRFDHVRKIAFQFAPWRTQYLTRVPETCLPSVSAEETQEAGPGAWSTQIGCVDVSVGGEEWTGALEEVCCEGGGLGGGVGGAREEMLTVVIPVYWRPRMAATRAKLRALVAMDVVDRVIIVLNNPDWAAPACLVSEAHARGKVFIVRGEGLNDRFAPRKLVRTRAVLSMDDDFAPTEFQLQRLLGVWKRFPERLVGPMWLVNRHAEQHTYDNGEIGFRYGTDGWKGYYNVILTGFALFHRGYMPVYSSWGGPLEQMRAHVHAHNNCEDLAMNFLVAEASGAAPVGVELARGGEGGMIAEPDPSPGLSDLGGGHYRERTRCLGKFAELLGGFPLVRSEAGRHRTKDHAFGSVADAEAEAAEERGEGRVLEQRLQCAWQEWVNGSGEGCGFERFGALPAQVCEGGMCGAGGGVEGE